MTAADKEKIRAAIRKATGQPVGEIYPEAFISGTGRRGVIVTAVNCEAPTPHTNISFLTIGGVLIRLGAFGHN